MVNEIRKNENTRNASKRKTDKRKRTTAFNKSKGEQISLRQ